MNAADNGIIAVKKHNQLHSGNCMALITGLFILAKQVPKNSFLQYGNAYTRSQFRNAS